MDRYFITDHKLVVQVGKIIFPTNKTFGSPHNLVSCSLSMFVFSYIEPVSSLSFLWRAELQASDSRYQAQRRITQLLQTELLQLYSRVEMEAPASTTSCSPPEGRDDPHMPCDSRSEWSCDVTFCHAKVKSVFQSLLPPTCMSKYPWVIHWALSCL